QKVELRTGCGYRCGQLHCRQRLDGCQVLRLVDGDAIEIREWAGPASSDLVHRLPRQVEFLEEALFDAARVSAAEGVTHLPGCLCRDTPDGPLPQVAILPGGDAPFGKTREAPDRERHHGAYQVCVHFVVQAGLLVGPRPEYGGRESRHFFDERCARLT